MLKRLVRFGFAFAAAVTVASVGLILVSWIPTSY